MFLKKHLGQHFMKDRNILAKEARILSPAGKTVLEIGAGDGRLTEQLLDAGAKKVVVVEKDARLASLLARRFSGKNVEILNSDFLQIPLETFDGVEKVAGNIPYYISSQIIFRLSGLPFENAVLMVQEEFARKMVAQPKSSNYGRLSVTSKMFFGVKYVQKVPRALFSPIPRVDSAIILLSKKPASYAPDFEGLVRSLFQHKNKIVRNALRDAGFQKESLERIPAQLLKKRPREMELAEIEEIYEKIK